MKLQRGEWFGVLNAAVDAMADVGGTACLVYLALCRHADEERVCFPGVAMLAQLCGVHRSTVLRALTTLEAAGWVTIKKQEGRRNLYTLPPIPTGSTGATGSVGATGSTGATGSVGATGSTDATGTSSTRATGTGSTGATLTRPKKQDLRNKTKKGRVTSEDPPIPKPLNTPTFTGAWQRWLGYRRKRRLTLAPQTLQSQLEKLTALGPAAAVDEIDASIGHGWQSLCYENNDARPNGKPRADSPARIRQRDFGALVAGQQ